MQRQQNATARPVVPGKPILSQVRWPSSDRGADVSRVELSQINFEGIFAGAAYQGAKTAAAIAKTGTWKLAIVKRDELHRFLVLPKRWIVTVCAYWAQPGFL